MLLLILFFLFPTTTWAYDVLIYKDSMEPVYFVEDTEKVGIYGYCSEGDPLTYFADTDMQQVNSDIAKVEKIPKGGVVDPVNENCENPRREEIWVTHKDLSSFLVYRRACADDPSKEANYDNGGRFYKTGDADKDAEIRDIIKDFWTWGALNSGLASFIVCSQMTPR